MTQSDDQAAARIDASAAPIDDARPPHPRRRGGRVILLVIVVVALVGSVLYALRVPVRRELAQVAASVRGTHQPAGPDRLTTAEAAITALQAKVDALEQRTEALAAAAPPPPAPPAEPVKPAAEPPPAPTPTPSPSGTDPMVVALSTRMDALAARQDHLDAQQTTQAAKVEAAANQAATLDTLADATKRMQSDQHAQSALEAGRPLGTLPDAPPALARFATTPPPTEAALRLAYPQAAERARAATRPNTAQLGFWQAMRARAESLVTIRRDDRLILGNEQAVLLDRARVALDAGDLAGAVATLRTLTGLAAEAMQDWLTKAQALLDARAALAQYAAPQDH